MTQPAARRPARVRGALPDLCDPGTVQRIARRYGIGLSRRMGQHFLVDASVRDLIVDALEPGAEDVVIEIGAGIGTLTVEVARRAGRVVAVELDAACVAALTAALKDRGNVEIVHGDALRVDLAAAFAGRRAEHRLAAGNIPYSLTGAIIPRIVESEPAPRRTVLLVQREVAARLAAAAGDWSLATVAVRCVADVERLRDVPPEAFLPPPAVHSSVIRLVPARRVPAAERRAILDLARGAFQQRRKTLRHGMAAALAGRDGLAMEVLAAAGVDSRRRPGTLTVEEWRALAAAAATVAPGG